MSGLEAITTGVRILQRSGAGDIVSTAVPCPQRLVDFNNVVREAAIAIVGIRQAIGFLLGCNYRSRRHILSRGNLYILD